MNHTKAPRSFPLLGSRLRLAALCSAAAALSAAPLPAAPENLDALPKYEKPAGAPVNGEIRAWVNKSLTNLLRLWEVGFLKYNVGVCHIDVLESGAITIGGLYAGGGDIGFPGHRAYPMERLGYERVYGYEPLELAVARGSFETIGQGPCNIIFVNKANPVSQLTVRQVDGIFGSERTGGWDGIHWSKALARGADENIRTWGQLGLTGEWAGQPIRVFGYALTEGSYSLWLQEEAFKGGDAWAPSLTEAPLGELNKTDPHLGGLKTLEAIAKDPYAIGYTNMQFYNMGKNLPVKMLALAADDRGPFAVPSEENFRNRSYPLLESAYLYVNRVPGKPMDRGLTEFLRYIFSRDGQKDVAEDGGYIPLNAEEVLAARAQLK